MRSSFWRQGSLRGRSVFRGSVPAAIRIFYSPTEPAKEKEEIYLLFWESGGQ